MCEVLTHPWQEKGLGLAPFRVVCIITTPGPAMLQANPEAYNRAWGECQAQASRFGVQLCSCYACGQSLANNVIIRDAAGKYIVVGLDCAARTGDHELISQAEALERQRQRAIRLAKAQAEAALRQARHEAQLQAERQRNGGLTDAELRQKEAQAEEARRQIQYSAENAWLLDVLAQAYQGDFVRSICAGLRCRPLADAVSGRARDIVAEIYAKTKGGRKNSKAYRAALDEIQERFPDQED